MDRNGAIVVGLGRQGAADGQANYRPVSLLHAACKLFHKWYGGPASEGARGATKQDAVRVQKMEEHH